jgi:hypothetical protein
VRNRENSKGSRRALIVGTSGLLTAGLLLCGGLAGDARACEPLHDLIFFGAPDPVPVQPEAQLCWASECRSFGGSDKGQFGDLKKDVFGQLEAIVQVITNETTGKVVTLVDKLANDVDCANLIPENDPEVECSQLLKVKGIRPIGEGLNAPLCTFNNLDDLDAVTSNPESQHVVVVDANGKQCEARVKGQFQLFYQDCCSPAEAFGSPGDVIATQTSLIVDNNGVCSSNPVRKDATGDETFPEDEAEGCL